MAAHLRRGSGRRWRREEEPWLDGKEGGERVF